MSLDPYLARRLKKTKRPPLTLKRFILWCAVFGFSFFMLIIFLSVGAYVYISRDLPSSEAIKKINFTQSTTIMDREGHPLYTVHGEENRELITLDQISDNMIKATIAAEDHRFYQHLGFYPTRIVKAFYNNLRNKLSGERRPLEGASTITQQLVKNTFLTPERTYIRKLKELILSIRVERTFTKNQILEMYLNKIPYGNNAYGVKRAAEVYFGVLPKDLTIAQSVILASLPQAPSRYNPYGEHRYPILLKEFDDNELKSRHIGQEADLSLTEFSRGLLGKLVPIGQQSLYIRGRADLILRQMAELGSINADQKTQAWENMQIIEFARPQEFIKAPHFVLYIKQLLEEKYGKEMVEQGGLKVYTTLDPKLQALAEQIITDKTKFLKDNFAASDAALLAVQPQTGQILSMVGSLDYYNNDIDGQVNMTIRPRQPGSSFKPIVYAQAFLKRYSPASIVYDVETKFDGGEPPRNFTGKFSGPVTLRYALGHSLNVPAIKVYFVAGEQKTIIPFAKKLGITSLDPKFDYGWPLAIGSGEVNLLEMVQAYSVLANGGIKKDLTAILKVENGQGQILEEWKPEANQSQVLDTQVAFLINDILSDPIVNLGQKVRLENLVVAAKTGTSNKRLTKEKILPNNAWIFGYTPKLVTGVWAGNADGTTMNIHGEGYDTTAPIWKEFMTEALKDQPSEPFPVPRGVKKITVSAANGKLPGKTTPTEFLNTDYFASFAAPTEIDTSFKEATIDKTTHELATPFCPKEQLETKLLRVHEDLDPTQERWAKGLDNWIAAYPDLANAYPKASCHLHSEATAKSSPLISIVSPSAYDTIGTGFTSVKVKIDAPHGVDRVEYYFDGNLQYTAKDSPYHGRIRYFASKNKITDHIIEVRIFDSLQYSSSTQIKVRLGGQPTVDSPEEENTNPLEPDAETTNTTPPPITEIIPASPPLETTNP